MTVAASLIKPSNTQVIEGNILIFTLRFTAQVASVSYSYSVVPINGTDVADFSGSGGRGSLSFSSSSVINEDVRIAIRALNDIDTTEAHEGLKLLVTVTEAAFQDGSTSQEVEITIVNDPVGIGSAIGEEIFGTMAQDTLYGRGGDDTILGGGGADQLFAEDGDDSIDGGDGDDLIIGGNGNDTVQGGTGRDSLTGSVGNDSLKGGGDADRILAGVGNDTAFGEAGDDTINGESGRDLVYGGGGNDSFLGAGGRDRLIGDVGDDWLQGGLGIDTLIGGAGADQFVIEGALRRQADFIQDFRSLDDVLVLADDVFQPLFELGDLAESFVLGRVATDSDDHLIYARKLGELYWDADGSGSAAAVLIAQFKPGTRLIADDFILA